jgi:hypothetical protein
MGRVGDLGRALTMLHPRGLVSCIHSLEASNTAARRPAGVVGRAEMVAE